MFMFSALLAGATHIVGGEIFYKVVSDNTYQVTVLIYRDCGPTNSNNQGFDNPSHLGIFRGGNLVKDIGMTDFTVRLLPVELTNPCLGLPPGVCIEEARFQTTIVLSQSPDDYVLVWERCCRSPAIQNIENARDYGLSLYAIIPGTDKTSLSNNSPFFKNLPPLAFCLNDAVVFDHSAIDDDGDSLVYGLTAPYNGGDPSNPMPVPPNDPQFIKVPWSQGYSDLYPIDSDPAIQIDPVTGRLTLTTKKIGAYAFGVYVQEWRNGVLLSTNIRDFQFNVVNCSSEVEADIVPQSVFCNGSAFNFTNNSTKAKYFQWRFGSLTNPLDSSNQENPSYTFPNYGDYQVYLIANPGYACADTAMQLFQIREQLDVMLDSQQVQCLTTNDFTLKVTGNYKPSATFNWTVPQGTSIGADRDSMLMNVRFSQSGWFVYQVVINNNDCQSTLIDSVEVESPFIKADFVTSATQCVGTTVSFFNRSEFTNNFYWDLGSAGFSEERDPVVQFPDTGTYVIELTAGRSTDCLDKHSITIDLKPDYQVALDLPDTLCLDSNEVYAAVIGTGIPASFTTGWATGNDATVSDLGGDDSIHGYHYFSAGTKYISAMVMAYGCTRGVTDSVVLIANPDPQFVTSVVNGCVPLEVGFQLANSYPVPLEYEWNFGLDGSSKASAPVFIYTVPDIYYPKLTVISPWGCKDTVTVVLDSGLIVYPLPSVGFNVDKELVPIDEPYVNIYSKLQDNSRMYFKVSDGATSTDSAFRHAFPDADEYKVWQFNETEYGCLDSAYKIVVIDGYTAYIPSAFTPDEDGYNDEFVPIVSNSKSYEFRIYDRWGQEIFYSARRGEGWKGVFKGKLSPIGVYNYTLKLVDFQNRPHQFIGSVSLIR